MTLHDDVRNARAAGAALLDVAYGYLDRFLDWLAGIIR